MTKAILQEIPQPLLERGTRRHEKFRIMKEEELPKEIA
jgi:hypothetical protein